MRLRLFEPLVEKTSVQGPSTTIVIADDHPLFRGALRQAIASLMPCSNVLEAGGLPHPPAPPGGDRRAHLVLLRLPLPGGAGLLRLVYFWAPFPPNGRTAWW